ncbi:MAG: FAD-dependent thymidylate synthase [Aestuariivita sp.]|nr:FAD-dependent thymidylate synthase [Aestuariivita sp.]MCY4201442.1 FAD-dependent thymidylate synthase [Aestuariivita sp.]MCY4289839.1 FAD-dependent thymidylate synthase [Aestuariivita sp.]MCY4347884.1 FAD-dependent thymidylate synthase [Aestuariivita sp.]
MVLSSDQASEIEQQQSRSSSTRRVVSKGMEHHLFDPKPVLDHGFIRVIDYMGDDGAIAQAARVSYGIGTKSVQNDEGLIRYLMRHAHTTPFEMCEVKLHVKLPVFVARQWIRHRTANVNEYSARYSILDREFYFPKPENISTQSATNNQGRGEPLAAVDAERVLEILKTDASRCYDNYEVMVSQDDQFGIARELARMNLPANIYTQWYWKIDLHNLFHFLKLRADSHAQFEIRAYADELCNIVADWVPVAFRAFQDYQLGAVVLSAQMVTALKSMLQGEDVSRETSGMSAREWREFSAEFIAAKS